MKNNALGKIQIIVLVAVAIYVVMPDLFVGPIDDAAIATIAGIAEAVLGIIRAVSDSHPDYLTDEPLEIIDE